MAIQHSLRVMCRRDFGHLIFALICLILTPAHAGIDRGSTSGPQGGRIAHLAIALQTLTTLYAASQGAGILKSIDGGASWREINNGFTQTFAITVMIDPLTPSTLYAGGNTSRGIFKSSDGGNSWAEMKTGITAVFLNALESTLAIP